MNYSSAAHQAKLSKWASSIRYHMGKFYVWFTANGAPGKGFLFSAEKAEGPWTLVSRPPHMHDGSLFFDEDGKVYMFCENGHLIELRPDLTGKLEGGLDKQLLIFGKVLYLEIIWQLHQI